MATSAPLWSGVTCLSLGVMGLGSLVYRIRCLAKKARVAPERKPLVRGRGLGRLFFADDSEGTRETLQTLTGLPERGDTLIGTCTEVNLDFISAREGVTHVYILDANPEVKAYFKRLGEAICSCESRADFARLIRTDNTFSALRSKVVSDPRNKSGWLQSEESYQRIRTMFNEGRFECRTMNLFETGQVRAFMGEISGQGRTVDTVYLSNVAEYASERERVAEFEASRKALLAGNPHRVELVNTNPALRQVVTPSK